MNERAHLGFLTLFALLLSGCSSSYRLIRTAKEKPVEKPSSCHFMLLTAAPQWKYEEVATLQSQPEEMALSAKAFRSAIQDDVCEAGGDAVIAKLTEYGGYTQGTVIRWK